jgi:hypothetical protein
MGDDRGKLWVMRRGVLGEPDEVIQSVGHTRVTAEMPGFGADFAFESKKLLGKIFDFESLLLGLLLGAGRAESFEGAVEFPQRAKALTAAFLSFGGLGLDRAKAITNGLEGRLAGGDCGYGCV